MSQRAVLYFIEKSRKPDMVDEDLLYYSRAIHALEKQVPKLVDNEKTFWRYRHYCPSCHVEFIREGLIYCDNCGQRLDWSNYWEALK